MNKYAPPLQGLANNMAQHGRYGDSMLVHMNPVEVQGIASLSPTGQLTTNPVTGQPEAFLPMLAPLLGGALGSAALTGAGAGILGSGLSSAMAGAIGSGLASWAESGDMKEGLMSGLTGYGIGKAFGALGSGGKAAAEGTKQAALDPGLWTDATQGLIESGAAAAADPAAASLYQETTKGLGGMGERFSLMKSQRGQLIPNLMQQSPLIATGEMGRSQMQANKELEDSLSNLGEEDEDSLQRQYDILGGAWKQLQRDYNYPVQPYPRYANNGGFIKRYQEGGLLTGGPEQAAARQASIRGSVLFLLLRLMRLVSLGELVLMQSIIISAGERLLQLLQLLINLFRLLISLLQRLTQALLILLPKEEKAQEDTLVEQPLIWFLVYPELGKVMLAISAVLKRFKT